MSDRLAERNKAIVAAWRDVLPPWLADAQAAWERRQSILRARKAGQTLRAIGKHLNLSPERIRQIECQAIRKPIAPIERYFAEEPTDLAHLCKQYERKRRRAARAPIPLSEWPTLQVGDLIGQLTQQNKRLEAKIKALQADLRTAKVVADPNPALEQKLRNRDTEIKDLRRYEKEAIVWMANDKESIATLKRTLAQRDDSIATLMARCEKLGSEIGAKHAPYIKRAREAEAALKTAVKAHDDEIERKLARRRDLVAFIRYLAARLKEAGAWTTDVESSFKQIMSAGE
jgi:chromosome segregation ATPase